MTEDRDNGQQIIGQPVKWDPPATAVEIVAVLRASIERQAEITEQAFETIKRLRRRIDALHNAFDFSNCPNEECGGVIANGWICIECGHDPSFPDHPVPVKT